MSLVIGSFNVQDLGEKKFSNEYVMKIVTEIIRRYDIILIQEIVTKDQNRIQELLQTVNSDLEPHEQYKLRLSERLGSESAKEQYGYFFRSDKVKVLSDEVYSDPEKKVQFERPPYIVRFSTQTVDGFTYFFMIGIHTKPDKAVQEIHSLVKVYDDSRKIYRTNSAIILGDMNADGRYVRKKDWKKIALYKDKRFKWLIKSDKDTTTNPNTFAYDRIVIAGEGMKGAVIPGSGKVFNFQEKYKLNDEQARSVSDHYPVEVTLKGKQK